MSIKRNRAKCAKCGDIIESKFRHDFVTCGCTAISVDGGHSYFRRVGNYEDIIEIDDNGNETVGETVEEVIEYKPDMITIENSLQDSELSAHATKNGNDRIKQLEEELGLTARWLEQQDSGSAKQVADRIWEVLGEKQYANSA